MAATSPTTVPVHIAPINSAGQHGLGIIRSHSQIPGGRQRKNQCEWQGSRGGGGLTARAVTHRRCERRHQQSLRRRRSDCEGCSSTSTASTRGEWQSVVTADLFWLTRRRRMRFDCDWWDFVSLLTASCSAVPGTVRRCDAAAGSKKREREDPHSKSIVGSDKNSRLNSALTAAYLQLLLCGYGALCLWSTSTCSSLAACPFSATYLIGIVDKALASYSQGKGQNPTDTCCEVGGLTSPVIQVYGRQTLYGGAFAFFGVYVWVPPKARLVCTTLS